MAFKKLPILPGMRIAFETDFRSSKNTLKLNLEYYEWMLGTHNFEMRVTDANTNMEWLKTKISLGYILIHTTPILWNQNKKKQEQFTQLLNF